VGLSIVAKPKGSENSKADGVGEERRSKQRRSKQRRSKQRRSKQRRSKQRGSPTGKPSFIFVWQETRMRDLYQELGCTALILL
jgi:hypothetical protein